MRIIYYTRAAKALRDKIMAIDPKAKAYFAATFESLKNGEIPLKKEGTVVIDVEFTKYKMTLEIESDRIAKIKYIEISDIK